MNKVILSGYVSQNPEIRYAQSSGQAVGNFNLAVKRPKRKNEETALTDFLRCVTFGKTAEMVEKYVQKGTGLIIIGRIQTDNYTDQNGVKKYTTNIIVENIEFLPKGGQQQNNTQSGQYAQQQAPQQAPQQPPAQRPAPSAAANTMPDGFMNIPDGIEDELPFV